MLTQGISPNFGFPNYDQSEKYYNPVDTSFAASHLLPLIQTTSYENHPEIILIGDKTEYNIDTLFTKNSQDQGNELTNSFISTIDRAINISSSPFKTHNNLNIKNIDLGSLESIDNNDLITIKSILQNKTNSIIISLFPFKIGSTNVEILNHFINNNNILISPSLSKYTNNVKPKPNLIFISDLIINDPDLLFNYNEYEISDFVYDNSLFSFHVPLMDSYGYNITSKQFATVIFGIGYITLFSRNANNLYKLSLSIMNSSRILQKPSMNNYIYLPDFYQANKVYFTSQKIIVSQNPFHQLGFKIDTGERIYFHSGDTMQTTLKLYYHISSENNTSFESRYQVIVNASMSVDVPLLGNSGIIDLDLTLIVPLYQKSLILEFKFISDDNLVSSYIYKSIIKKPSNGYLGIGQSTSIKKSFFYDIRRSGWAIVLANITQSTTRYIDTWYITSIWDYFTYETMLNRTFIDGGNVILTLNANNLETWNSPTNYLSQIKLVNITSVLQENENSGFGTHEDDQSFYNIPMQITRNQPYLTPIDDLDVVIGKGILFDNIFESEDTISLVDAYPLNGIYSSLLEVNYLNGNLYLISDSSFLQDFINRPNINIITESLLKILDVITEVNVDVTYNNRITSIKISSNYKTILGNNAPIISLITDKMVEYKIRSVEKKGDELNIEVIFSSNRNINSTIFLHIKGLRMISINIEIQNNTILFDTLIVVISSFIVLILIVIAKKHLKNRSQAICTYCYGRNKGSICKYCRREIT